MHIVFLVHDFPVGGLATGGAGNYVANMARTMAHLGHRVSVITEAPQKETFEWYGVQVYKIRATRGFRNTGRPMPTYKKLIKNIWRSFWYNYEVYKLNKVEPIDIVQSVSSYALAFLRLKRIPYIIRVSEYMDLWVGANKEHFDFEASVTTKRFDNEIQYLALKRADSIIVPSYLIQKIIYNKIGKKPQVIESPIVIDKENLRFNEKDFLEEKYWVTFGALIYRKGIQMLALIIDKLLDKYQDMKYVMIGKDREVIYNGNFIMASEFFKIHIPNNFNRFIFLGEISDRNRLFSIVRNSYACILPTRIDNLPNTCLEAMALGKIVISSTSGNGTSVEQLITDGYNGFLAQVDDAKELYSKILRVMELSEEEKKNIGNRAYERVKDLTPEKVYEKMMNIYTKVIR